MLNGPYSYCKDKESYIQPGINEINLKENIFFSMNDKPKKIKSKKKSLVPAVRKKGGLVPPDPFTAYIQEAKKYPILSEEEEKELAIRLQ